MQFFNDCCIGVVIYCTNVPPDKLKFFTINYISLKKYFISQINEGLKINVTAIIKKNKTAKKGIIHYRMKNFM